MPHDLPSIPTSKVGQHALVLAQEVPQYQLHIVCIRIQCLSTDDIDQRVGEGIHMQSLHLAPEVVYKGRASGKCGLAPTIATTAPRPHHLSHFLLAALLSPYPTPWAVQCAMVYHSITSFSPLQLSAYLLWALVIGSVSTVLYLTHFSIEFSSDCLHVIKI